MIGAALLAAILLAGCGGAPNANLYVPDVVGNAQQYNGQTVSVNGTYIGRGDSKVLALGVSTLDNGQDATAIGDPIWLENFPEDQYRDQLHQPGDSIYGFVKVTGTFQSGGSYGPDQRYKYQLQVAGVEPIEQVRRTEVRIPGDATPQGGVAFADLAGDPTTYNGQKVTTRAYYFWNGPTAVLAEGVSQEEDGSNPQPVGKQIWIEGFPADVTGKLKIGPNSPPSYVWGYVEVTGTIASGGQFGRDGAFPAQMNAESAQALEQK